LRATIAAVQEGRGWRLESGNRTRAKKDTAIQRQIIPFVAKEPALNGATQAASSAKNELDDDSQGVEPNQGNCQNGFAQTKRHNKSATRKNELYRGAIILQLTLHVLNSLQ
jgi:hypothetical protein